MVKSFDELPAIVHSDKGSKVLGISVQTYRSLCREGVLPAVHIGRQWVITKEKLIEFLNGGDNND